MSAAPKTGVINANILITKNNVMDIKGIKTLRFLKPGADSVLLVINKFVNDMVVLTPDNKALIIAISWAPTLVNRNLDENGVINVQPDIVNEALLHLTKNFFLSLWRIIFVTTLQKASGILFIEKNIWFFKKKIDSDSKECLLSLYNRALFCQALFNFGFFIKSKYKVLLSPGFTKVGLKKAGLASKT